MTEAIATQRRASDAEQSRSWAAASPGSPPLKNWQSAASTSRCTNCAQMSAAALTTTREASVPLSSSAGSPPPSTPRSARTPGASLSCGLPDRRGHPRDPGRAVAGEHGFRFFPAYYIHIWDLFQRIPVYERIDLGHGEIRWTDLAHDHGQRSSGGHPGHHGRRQAVACLPARGAAQPRRIPHHDTPAHTTGLHPAGYPDFREPTTRLPRHQSRAPCKRAAESVGVRLLRRARCTGKSRPVQLLGPLQLRSARNAASSRRIRHALWRCPHQCVDLSAAPAADGPPRHQGRRGAQRPDLRIWFDHWYRHLLVLGVRFVHGGGLSRTSPR